MSFIHPRAEFSLMTNHSIAQICPGNAYFVSGCVPLMLSLSCGNAWKKQSWGFLECSSVKNSSISLDSDTVQGQCQGVENL